MSASPHQLQLKAWRAYKGWSQAELGRRIGRSKSQVSEAEAGDHVPRPNVIERYAAAFGVRVEDLYRRPQDVDPFRVFWEKIPPDRRAMALRMLETLAEPDDPPPDSGAGKPSRKNDR